MKIKVNEQKTLLVSCEFIGDADVNSTGFNIEFDSSIVKLEPGEILAIGNDSILNKQVDHRLSFFTILNEDFQPGVTPLFKAQLTGLKKGNAIIHFSDVLIYKGENESDDVQITTEDYSFEVIDGIGSIRFFIEVE